MCVCVCVYLHEMYMYERCSVCACLLCTFSLFFELLEHEFCDRFHVFFSQSSRGPGPTGRGLLSRGCSVWAGTWCVLASRGWRVFVAHWSLFSIRCAVMQLDTDHRAEIDGGWIVCLVKTSKVRMLCMRMPSRQLPASLSIPLTLFN